ncbi:hypothetical protein RRG08_057756 [Elysia crispata]|uniref:Uncharacterized protein n=1 Tax=Elysia crispata TaxID=231223 RepID=A0AAE0YHN8_9GAST|nr:hypothetical protein RRG08_057756 [Elysia crispata]
MDYLLNLLVGVVLTLTVFPACFLTDVRSPNICGYIEEGSTILFTCSSKSTSFSSFGPRVEINQTFPELGFCDSNGRCNNNDATRYNASYLYDSSTGRNNVTLRIKNVTRNMNKWRCYEDGISSYECLLITYIAPAKPVCKGPEFVEHGEVAQVTCSSDRVYPTAECELGLSFQNKAVPMMPKEKIRLSGFRDLTDSEQYPGDKKLTCWFKLQLANILEGRYQFGVMFYAQMPNHKPNSIWADAIQDLILRATTLENPEQASTEIAVAPKPKELTLNISVISNPPPNRFSLSVRQNESSTLANLSSNFYSVHYRSKGDGSLKGTIELTVSTSAVTVEERFNYFVFTASNNVVGSDEFQYKFTWIRLDIVPTLPTCNAPVFIDQVATVLFTCSVDRVFPSGLCSFQPTVDSIRENVLLSMRTKSNNSKAYPGQQTVTCELHLPIAQTRAGVYQYQVEITSSMKDGNQSVFATTPKLNLGATTLENPEQASTEIAVAPKPKELTLNISVISNPPPNRFSLAVRQNESSTLANLSSNFYSVHYRSKGDGSLKGTIELTVSTSAVTVEERFNYFVFTASNNVVGSDEFQYKFTWIRLDIVPTLPTCNAPVFIDQVATVLFTCSVDRVFPSGLCSFQPTVDSIRENVLLTMRTKSNNSKAYPGQQTVTCELHLPIAQNRAGVYQFQVEITSSMKDGNQSVFATTPKLNLGATTLENPEQASTEIAVAPKPKELTLNISVISNPPPNRFSLAVRQNESSTLANLSSNFYSVHYRSKGDGSLKGTIELTVSTSAVTVEERFNYFVFTASNNVVGSDEFQYKFTWIRLDIVPTLPTCNAPVFIDQVATVLFTCSVDRVFPSGLCSFQPTVDSIRENVLLTMRTKSNNSKAYPGQQTVTCELHLPIAQNRAGVYQFQVEITSSMKDGNQSVFATTPKLNLGATTLENPEQASTEIAVAPKPKELTLNISVISNPPPNRFSLAVRQNESSTLANLSSNFYSVHYRSKGDGSLKGTIELTVSTSAVTVEERFNYFVFTASNNVVGNRAVIKLDRQFSCAWTVPSYGHIQILPTQPTCDGPVFIDQGATVLFSCSADRVYPSGLCSFQPIADSLRENMQVAIRTKSENSTAYPGQQSVTCELYMPVVRISAGVYQFQVEITPSVKDGNQSVFATTPKVNLANVLPQVKKGSEIEFYWVPIFGGVALVLGLIAALTVFILRRKRNAQSFISKNNLSNQKESLDTAYGFLNTEFNPDDGKYSHLPIYKEPE